MHNPLNSAALALIMDRKRIHDLHQIAQADVVDSIEQGFSCSVYDSGAVEPYDPKHWRTDWKITTGHMLAYIETGLVVLENTSLFKVPMRTYTLTQLGRAIVSADFDGRVSA